MNGLVHVSGVGNRKDSFRVSPLSGWAYARSGGGNSRTRLAPAMLLLHLDCQCGGRVGIHDGWGVCRGQE